MKIRGRCYHRIRTEYVNTKVIFTIKAQHRHCLEAEPVSSKETSGRCGPWSMLKLQETASNESECSRLLCTQLNMQSYRTKT